MRNILLKEKIMKYIKAILIVLAADFLSLFVSIPFAASAKTEMKILSLICAVGVLGCMLVSFAAKTARADRKLERTEGKANSLAELGGMCAAITLPSALSWAVLYLSLDGGPDFYRFYKLINAPFLQIYNFIERDASSKALSTGEVLAMLPTVIVPGIIFAFAYLAVYRSEDGKPRKNPRNTE